MAEKNASLETLRHRSGFSERLPCTPLKLSTLPARNQLCMKLPLLTSGAMHHSLSRLVLVEKGGLSAAACSCSRKLRSACARWTTLSCPHAGTVTVGALA